MKRLKLVAIILIFSIIVIPLIPECSFAESLECPSIISVTSDYPRTITVKWGETSNPYGTTVEVYDFTHNKLYRVTENSYSYTLDRNLIAGETVNIAIRAYNVQKDSNGNITKEYTSSFSPTQTITVRSGYYVIYNSNGGTGTPEPQEKKELTDLVLSSQAPKKTGCTFLGWATSKDSDVIAYQPGDKYKTDKDITLYAVWQQDVVVQEYTISYDANGGSGAPAAQTKIEGQTLVLSSKAPSREGYNFLGWADTRTATKASYQPGQSYKSDSDKTLYAVWEKIEVTFEVKYHANGGSGAPSSQIKTVGKSLVLTSEEPTRTGYEFIGWSKNGFASVATYQAGDIFDEDSNSAITLYAVWQAETYQIAYNANGGTGAPSTQTKEYDRDILLETKTPYRAGYVFSGWSTNSSASTVDYQPGDRVIVNKSMTLYAVWKRLLTSCDVSVTSGDSFVYDGSTKSITLKITDGSKLLTNGTHFTVSNNSRVDAGTQTVSSIGIGDYTGSITRRFTVSKAKLSISVQKSSVTVRKDASFDNSWSYSSGGTLTKTSSNTSVATVNANGQINLVGAGVTKITGTVSKGSNYEPARASYTLTVTAVPFGGHKALSFKKVKFKKLVSGKATESICKVVYNKKSAKKMYKSKYNNGQNGCCFGMATCAGLFYSAGINPSSVKDLSKKYTWKSGGKKTTISVSNQIKAMQVTFAADQHKDKWSTKSTTEVMNAVKTDLSNNRMTVITLGNGSNAHSVDAIGFDAYSSTQDRIIIYDSYYDRDSVNYLYLNKNDDGSYNGQWKYTKNKGSKIYSSSDGAYLQCTPYSVYNSMWTKRGSLTF